MESALVHDTHQLGEAIAVSHKKRRPRFRGRFIKNSRQPLLFLLQQVNPDLAFWEKRKEKYAHLNTQTIMRIRIPFSDA